MVKYSSKYYFQKILQIELVSIDAALIFGSRARGDSDGFSDLDLLLVSKEPNELKLASSRLKRYGWSCSTYTWTQLINESKRRSLFIQHLKLEGVIIKDSFSKLRDLLYHAEPRSSYSWEIEQAMDLMSIIEYIPADNWGPIWALDVLMVGFRSLSYALLANEGMFRFSFKEVLESLNKIGILKESDIPELLNLRQWKYLYRVNIDTLPCLNERALKLIDLVDKRMRIGIHVNFIGPKHFVIKQNLRITRSQHWYKNSRALEAIVRLYPMSFSKSLKIQLCNPQGYCLALRNIDSLAIVSKALAA